MTAEDNRIQDNEQSNERYDLIRWRREQVLKLRAKGYTYDKIVETLKAGHPDIAISHGTIANDITAIKEEVNKSLADFVQNELPYENKLCLSGIQEIIRLAWEIADDKTKDDKVRLAALSVAKEVYLTEQALLGDSRILEQAVQWIKRAKKRPSVEQEQQEQEVTANS